MNNIVGKMARAMAYLGGLVLCFLIVLTCLSIVGRSLNGVMHSDLFQTYLPGFANWMLALGVGPIDGDYELVQAGMAFTVFAFLPLCQISVAHASVDVFADFLPGLVSRFLIWISEVAFAFILILIAYELLNGTGDKYRSGETTLLLQFPIWWAYALSLVGAIMAALASVYMAYLRTLELASGKKLVSGDTGAEH